MSLRRYFKPANKLPTADKAGLSANVVKEVNQVVTRTLERSEASAGKKRKYTTTFTSEDRAAIARYAAQNGNSAAVKKFKASHNVGESTVRSFKKKYLEELKKQPNPGNEAEEVTSLPARKRGRKVMLGEDLDDKVQNYVEALCTAGTPIGSNIVMAAGEGIVIAHDRTLLVAHGGHITITKSWAMSLLKRMGYVKRKATTKSSPGMSGEDFERMKKGFLQQIVPTGEWTMAAEGSKRVEVVGLGDKRQITATFACSLDGIYLSADADTLPG